jgi:hypothetical protein
MSDSQRLEGQLHGAQSFWTSEYSLEQLRNTTPNFTQFSILLNVLTTANRLSFSEARWMHSMPSHLNSVRLIVLLSSHLRRCLASGPFPSSVHTKPKPRMHLLSPHACNVLHPSLLLSFDHQMVFGEQHNSWTLSIRSFLQTPFTPSPYVHTPSPAPHSPRPSSSNNKS